MRDNSFTPFIVFATGTPRPGDKTIKANFEGEMKEYVIAAVNNDNRLRARQESGVYLEANAFREVRLFDSTGTEIGLGWIEDSKKINDPEFFLQSDGKKHPIQWIQGAQVKTA